MDAPVVAAAPAETARGDAHAARARNAPRDANLTNAPSARAAFARASHARGCPGRARAGPRARALALAPADRRTRRRARLQRRARHERVRRVRSRERVRFRDGLLRRRQPPRRVQPAPFAPTDETDPTRASRWARLAGSFGKASVPASCGTVRENRDTMTKSESRSLDGVPKSSRESRVADALRSPFRGTSAGRLSCFRVRDGVSRCAWFRVFRVEVPGAKKKRGGRAFRVRVRAASRRTNERPRARVAAAPANTPPRKAHLCATTNRDRTTFKKPRGPLEPWTSWASPTARGCACCATCCSAKAPSPSWWASPTSGSRLERFASRAPKPKTPKRRDEERAFGRSPKRRRHLCRARVTARAVHVAPGVVLALRAHELWGLDCFEGAAVTAFGFALFGMWCQGSLELYQRWYECPTRRRRAARACRRACRRASRRHATDAWHRNACESVGIASEDYRRVDRRRRASRSRTPRWISGKPPRANRKIPRRGPRRGARGDAGSAPLSGARATRRCALAKRALKSALGSVSAFPYPARGYSVVESSSFGASRLKHWGFGSGLAARFDAAFLFFHAACLPAFRVLYRAWRVTSRRPGSRRWLEGSRAGVARRRGSNLGSFYEDDGLEARARDSNERRERPRSISRRARDRNRFGSDAFPSVQDAPRRPLVSSGRRSRRRTRLVADGEKRRSRRVRIRTRHAARRRRRRADGER